MMILMRMRIVEAVLTSAAVAAFTSVFIRFLPCKVSRSAVRFSDHFGPSGVAKVRGAVGQIVLE